MQPNPYQIVIKVKVRARIEQIGHDPGESVRTRVGKQGLVRRLTKPHAIADEEKLALVSHARNVALGLAQHVIRKQKHVLLLYAREGNRNQGIDDVLCKRGSGTDEGIPRLLVNNCLPGGEDRRETSLFGAGPPRRKAGDRPRGHG